MSRKLLTSEDIDLLQFENSIVIGNSAKIPAEKCDVLYESGTDFTSVFDLACETAKNKGVNTIKILSGNYACATPLSITNEVKVVGDGMPYIHLSPDFVGDGLLKEIEVLFISSPNVMVEGIRIGKGYGEEGYDADSLGISSENVKLKNITTEAAIWVGGNNVTITHSNVPSIDGYGVENCIIAHNIVGEITLSEDANAITGNIINGVPQSSGGEGGGTVISSDLPKVTNADNGKVLTVSNGKWAAKDLPQYDGEYSVTPSAEGEITLETAQKLLDADIKVNKIPYSEVSNNSGGNTVFIGSEV